MESAIDGEINNGERFRVETGYKIIKIFSKVTSVGILQGAGYKTWHKITVRSYKQPFHGKNKKKRGLITNTSGMEIKSEVL